MYEGLASDSSPVLRSGAFLTPGTGMGEKSGSGSGINNPDHISDSLETIFWVKILNLFDGDPGWNKFGSGINIPDPQHCCPLTPGKGGGGGGRV
jgi:hypothetical protein